MVRARKRFGQHFLTDEGVLQAIVRAVGIRPGDRVLEIGPGQGALTEHLLGYGALYRAVEIDRDLIPHLQARYPQLELINADILRVDLDEVMPEGDEPWRVVGNLPYNISSPLLAALHGFVAKHPQRIADMHFMLQREMADRLSAQVGSKAWGRLSVMLQMQFEIEHILEVPPESFSPPPKVFSSVIRMRPIIDSPHNVDLKDLDRVLRLAFSGRRKRLSNSLKGLDLDWSDIDLDPGLRADNVSLENYVLLAQKITTNPAAHS